MFDTAYLQAQILGDGPIPPATYTIDDTLTVPAHYKLSGYGVNIVGHDMGSKPMIRIGDGQPGFDSVFLEGLHLTCDGGVGILCDYVFDCHLEKTRIDGADIGILIDRCYQMHVSGVSIRKCKPQTGVGIRMTGNGSDAYLRDVRIVGDDPAGQPLYGIDIDHANGIWMHNVGTIYGGTGLRIRPGVSQVVEHLFLTNCSFDLGNANGIYVGGDGVVRGYHDTQGWASSNDGSGVFVQGGAMMVNLVGMRCINNKVHGIQLTGSDMLVDGCTLTGNGSGMVPAYHGLVLGAVTGVRVVNNRIGRCANYGNTQGYGIFMASGSASKIIISNNDLRNNATGPWFLQGGYQLGVNYLS